MRYLIKRLRRIREIWGIFGWHEVTWLTIFPPFRGWDVGCGYCALEQESLKAGRCKRGKEFGYEKCGVLKEG